MGLQHTCVLAGAAASRMFEQSRTLTQGLPKLEKNAATLVQGKVRLYSIHHIRVSGDKSRLGYDQCPASTTQVEQLVSLQRHPNQSFVHAR
jgi:hypothetical protein